MGNCETGFQKQTVPISLTALSEFFTLRVLFSLNSSRRRFDRLKMRLKTKKVKRFVVTIGSVGIRWGRVQSKMMISSSHVTQ